MFPVVRLLQLLVGVLLLAPVADACSLAPPPQHALDIFHWSGPDAVVAYWQPGWLLLNVSSNVATFHDERPVSPASAPRPERRVASPDGRFQLQITWDASDAINTCTNRPDPYVAGLRLLDAQGNVQHAWNGQPHAPWRGAFWTDGTTGFVWDPGKSNLTRIPWATGTALTFHMDDGATYAPDADRAPVIWGHNRLILPLRDGAGILDVETLATTTIHSPFPGGWTSVRPEGVFFGGWGDGGYDAALVAPDSTDTAWRIEGNRSGSSSGYFWNRHAYAVARGVDVALYMDGTLTRTLPVAAGERVSFREQDGRLAIGIAGDHPRIIVLDADLQQVAGFGAAPKASPPLESWALAMGLLGVAARRRKR